MARQRGRHKAAKLGHDVIMTPNSHFYFDYYQSPDADAEPFGIGGCVTIDKVYSFDPMADLTPGAAGAYPRRAGKPLDGVHRF